MKPEIVLAVSLFAFVTSITPGPNNLMLLASGVNFGFRATLPHMFGIGCGLLTLVLAVGLGLAEAFARLPWLFSVLRWMGAAYLLYLAWRIATSGPPDEPSSSVRSAKPMSFWQAAAFQWVNPKVWVMTMSTFSTYVPASSGSGVIVAIATLFVLISLPSVSIWTLFGSGLRQILQVRRNLVIFNYSMAAALMLSLYPLLKAI
ncbi:MAG TPA: LysE family translocator [Gammaproteobacteria bacterium]|nr:LysE family translocator [Gammaproteobacteria bacterium]